MSQKVSSIFEGDIYVIPMADISHLEKIPKEEAVFVITKNTRWNNENDEWENVAYLAGEELTKFEKAWRKYRESIENG